VIELFGRTFNGSIIWMSRINVHHAARGASHRRSAEHCIRKIGVFPLSCPRFLADATALLQSADRDRRTKVEAPPRSLRGRASRGGARERTSEKRRKWVNSGRTPEITWCRSPRYYARRFTPCIKGPFKDREIECCLFRGEPVTEVKLNLETDYLKYRQNVKIHFSLFWLSLWDCYF